MTSPLAQLPHVSSGNTLTDLATGIANFAAGLKKEKDSQREEAMKAALAKVQMDVGNANALHLGVETQLGTANLAEQTHKNEPAGMDELLRLRHSVPNAGMDLLHNPDGSGMNRGEAEAYILQVEQQNALAARAVMAQDRQDLRSENIGKRQEQRLTMPSPEENKRAGNFSQLLKAEAGIRQLEQADPEVLNRTGIAQALASATPKTFEPIVANLQLKLAHDPQAQAYLARLSQYYSAYLFGKGGTQLTENEINVMVPGRFAGGFVTPEAQKVRQEIRHQDLIEILTSAGRGIIPLIEHGIVTPADLEGVQPGLYEQVKTRFETQFGYDTSHWPQSAQSQQPIPAGGAPAVKPHARFLTGP